MVTIEVEGARAPVEINRSIGAAGTGTGVAAGYPVHDSIESMAQPPAVEQTKAVSFEDALAAAWDMAYSIFEGAFNFLCSVLGGLFSFIRRLSSADYMERQHVKDLLATEIELWKYNSDPLFMKFPNSTTFAIKITSGVVSRETELITHKFNVESSEVFQEAVLPVFEEVLGQATRFAESHEVTKVEMFLLSRFNTRTVETGQEVSDFQYVHLSQTAESKSSGCSSYKGLPLDALYQHDPLLKMVARESAEDLFVRA